MLFRSGGAHSRIECVSLETVGHGHPVRHFHSQPFLSSSLPLQAPDGANHIKSRSSEFRGSSYHRLVITPTVSGFVIAMTFLFYLQTTATNVHFISVSTHAETVTKPTSSSVHTSFTYLDRFGLITHLKHGVYWATVKNHICGSSMHHDSRS